MRTRNIIALSIASAVVAFIALPALAADPQLIVPIKVGSTTLTSATTNPATYIKTIYQWAIGFAALLAMAQLVIGGVRYSLAAGNVGSKEAANETMRNAVIGLVLLLSIVTILTVINPRLTSIKPAEVTDVRITESQRRSGDTISQVFRESPLATEAFNAASLRNQAFEPIRDDDDRDCQMAAHSIRTEDDFRTNLEAALQENNQASGAAAGSRDAAYHRALYNCYQDSIIMAVHVVQQTAIPDLFAELVQTFKNNTEFTRRDSAEYLNADPFSRSRVTVEAMRADLIKGLEEDVAQTVTALTQAIDKGQVTTSSFASNLEDIEESAAAIGYVVRYAKKNLSSSNYTRFKNAALEAGFNPESVRD